jgi:ABC-type multidrug transport system ATPase subunit
MNDIQVHKVSKSYDQERVLALDQLSLEVGHGELFGLIGPDGAGKTSLFRILTTLLEPEQGSAKVCGLDVIDDFKEIRRIVGYMPGKFSLYQDLTVEENLKFFATLFNASIEENYHLISDIYVHLEPFKKRRAGKLSGGMKQKLALCCALIHRPRVLLLDEPTTGVDAVSRKEFWTMLKRLKEEGITILVSTPYMDEALQCERIALIQGGKLLSVDTPQNTIDAFPHPLYAARAASLGPLLKDLRAMEGVQSAYAFGDEHHISLDGLGPDQIQKRLEQQGHEQVQIELIEASIEDCFIQLMSQ